MKISGAYVRQRDKLSVTYNVEVRGAPGGAANWDSKIYCLDGDLAGESGGQLLAPIAPELFEHAIRAAVEGAIEAGLGMNR